MKKTIFLGIVSLLLHSSALRASDSDTGKVAFRKINPVFAPPPRRHELRLNGGPNINDIAGPFSGRGMVISADYGYKFRRQQYIRVGLRLNDIGINNFNQTQLNMVHEPAPLNGDTSSYSMQQTLTRQYSPGNTHMGITVGYEKNFGLSKVKFVLGADLYFGFHSLSVKTTEASYIETRTYDQATGLFSYHTDYQRYGYTDSRDKRITAGLIPRIGVRWQITPLFGLGLSLNPLIGYTHRLSGTETTYGDRPNYPGALRSYWIFQQNVEGSLIFSFAKRKPKEPRS